MTSRDFCYWLQGSLELSDKGEGFTPAQVDMIKRHLNMVFVHEIDPSMGDKTHQEKLNEAHTKTLVNVVSEKVAKPYYPNANPGGQLIRC